MPNIYAIGETIYDIIFRDNEPEAAKAGGAMLNTTVSLGRLSLPVSFVSEIGDDQAGNIINGFLNENGVQTSHVYRYHGKTTIALAFLNEKNDAQYTFHKYYPEVRLDTGIPKFRRGDILLFGAFYSLLPEIRQSLISFVKTAKEAGAIIIYDPNIRSPHKDEIQHMRNMILENFSLSDIVRGSDEDFKTIFNMGSGKEAYESISAHGCQYLVYTKSDVGVELHTPGGVLDAEVPEVKTMSTIGAGDSFNAGLIYGLYQLEKKPDKLSNSEFLSILKTAVSFGSHVCTHYENYISKGFAKNLMST